MCLFFNRSEKLKIYLCFLICNKTLVDERETILFDMFVVSIVLSKLHNLLEKLQFIYVYIAPWQLPWGSAFHAFAQPLAAPHTSLLLAQLVVSCLIDAPIMPLMGSALFVLSYMRPVKFWERSYKSRRVDNRTLRLDSQFNHSTNPDSENLNAIFYEHLTNVLRESLCGDVTLGRWGQVHQGDFYVLSSDYLNCLVHVVEMGNGFLTFQLRGLEFKGTYCQQRELEAITEDIGENDDCCCCKLGAACHLKYVLSINAAFQLRWVAWSIVARKYVVDAYRIVDNDLSLIVNFYSLRRSLVDFYVKSAIYYAIRSAKLERWLADPSVQREIGKFVHGYVEHDACFDANIDLDYDSQVRALTLAKFTKIYHKWIAHCRRQRLAELTAAKHISNVG